MTGTPAVPGIDIPESVYVSPFDTYTFMIHVVLKLLHAALIQSWLGFIPRWMELLEYVST